MSGNRPVGLLLLQHIYCINNKNESDRTIFFTVIVCSTLSIQHVTSKQALYSLSGGNNRNKLNDNNAPAAITEQYNPRIRNTFSDNIPPAAMT